MRRFTFIWAILLFALGVAPSSAQNIDGPTGSVEPLFGGRRPVSPNRTSQSLEMNIDTSGGYEHDPNSMLLDPTATAIGPRLGFYTGTATAATRYRVGQLRRSLEVQGRGLVTYQSDRPAPLLGGDVSVNTIVAERCAGRKRPERRYVSSLSSEE